MGCIVAQVFCRIFPRKSLIPGPSIFEVVVSSERILNFSVRAGRCEYAVWPAGTILIFVEQWHHQYANSRQSEQLELPTPHLPNLLSPFISLGLALISGQRLLTVARFSEQ